MKNAKTQELFTNLIVKRTWGFILVMLMIGIIFIPIDFDSSHVSVHKNEARWYENLKKIDVYSKTDIEVLFLGSSTMYNAIDDSLFYKLTGLRSLKLALFGDFGTYGDYELLKRWVASSDTSPKLVIMWHAFDFWPRSLAQREIILVGGERRELFGFYWQRSIDNSLARETIHFPLNWAASVFRAFLRENVVFLKYKDVIRSRLTNLGSTLVGFDSSSFINNPPVYKRPDDYWERQQKGIANYNFSPSFSNTYWLSKLISISEENDIIILWSRSPLNNKLLGDSAVNSSLSRYNRELTKYLNEFNSNNLQILNNTQIIVDQSMSGDLYHVNRYGRDYVTRVVARQVLDYQNRQIKK